MITHVALKMQDGWVESLARPNRHHHVIAMMREKGYSRADIAYSTQGFLDDNETFLDRLQGAAHALACGQITELKTGPDLFSEDLW